MPTNEQLPAPQRDTPAGFATKAPSQGMSPAIMAEQQRAKSEIEASLTIAAARPRDPKDAMDRILTSCQRPGLAEKAKYRYSRGGTAIEGVTIDLMEVVAQLWGNLDFGFRELARYPGVGGGAGESIVEAFAWDLESNVKRKVQFTVPHCLHTKRGPKPLTDPRDIYEWVANQAQRRVRTCLENIIPRDIYEAAGVECEKTMQATVGDMDKAIAGILPTFAEYGVTREILEARLQRRLETIAPAQVVHLRGIIRGFLDGISRPEDWFDMTLGEKGPEEPPKTPVEAAKEKMRSQQVAQPPAPTPVPAPVQPAAVAAAVQQPAQTSLLPPAALPPAPPPVEAAPAPVQPPVQAAPPAAPAPAPVSAPPPVSVPAP